MHSGDSPILNPSCLLSVQSQQLPTWRFMSSNSSQTHEPSTELNLPLYEIVFEAPPSYEDVFGGVNGSVDATDNVSTITIHGQLNLYMVLFQLSTSKRMTFTTGNESSSTPSQPAAEFPQDDNDIIFGTFTRIF